MISLLEIAKSIDEAEMKLKPKGGGKVVVFKNKDNYEDALKSGDYEEPEGSKKVKSKNSDIDFGRAADDEADDMDRDARFAADADDDEVEQAMRSAEDLADKYGIESDVAGNEQGLNRANIGAGGEYEGDNQLTVNYDDEQYHVGIQGEDAMQGPIGYMSFDSKEEMESALDRILGNEKIKNALKKGDSLEGMKDEIESLGKGGSDDDEADAKDNKHDISSHPFYRYYDSGANKGDDIEISDANSGPIDMDDIMDMLKKDPKIVGKMGDDVYFDGEDLVSSKFDDDTIGSVNYNMTLGDLKKQIMAYEPEETEESIKVIDGKKYKAIKESGKTINVNLKEKYDRTFRSLK